MTYYNYLLDSGLRRTTGRFRSDKDAWEGLRKRFDKSRFMTLYRLQEIPALFNNEKQYKASHQRCFGVACAGKWKPASLPTTMVVQIPICHGLTKDKWSFKMKNTRGKMSES